jgi:succinyl-diaminopimelate desuccinylase
VIFGPGEPQMAYQTDECCLVERIGEAEQLFRDIIFYWCES